MHPSRTGRRATAALAALGLVIGLLTALAPAAPADPPPPKPTATLPAAPPPNPSDTQINAVAARKQALADQIGVLNARQAQAQARLDDLQNKVEYAEQVLADRLTQLEQAKVAAKQAVAARNSAAAKVTAAQTEFVTYLQASYMDGMTVDVGDSPVALLGAKDPSSLLDGPVLAQYQSDNKIDAIGQLQQARVGKSNADAKARAAVERVKMLTEQAKQAVQAATDAVNAQQAVKAAIEADISTTETARFAAQEELATLNNQRAAFLSYKRLQEQIKAYQAYQAHLRAVAEAKRKAAARAAYLKYLRDKAAADARDRANRGNGSGGGGGGGGTSGGGSDDDDNGSSGPGAPSSGSWTAAKGRQAVARARSMIGTPYAWAGGGAYGKSYGACVPSAGAPYDCYVKGFDCSGLAMYAWGGSWWHHLAQWQYGGVGSYHPSRSNLKPGDLVFYGTRYRIHHVAIYIGDGRMIEAPYSGGYVQTNNVFAYSDYYGATRPFT